MGDPSPPSAASVSAEPAPPATSPFLRRALLALCVYALLAVVLTWPLLLHWTTHVAGDGSDDPALAWNLWWVRYSLLDLGRSPIYTDFMFYPIGVNLAYYTLTYLNAFLSIPIQFTWGLIPAVNLNLLLSFGLSGWGAYLFLHHLLRTRLGGRGDDPRLALAAFAGGCLYAFSSNKFLYASLGQFNIASSQWIPFYLLFLSRLTAARDLTARRAARLGVWLGLFLLLQALAEFIFASFLLIFTALWVTAWLVPAYRGAKLKGTADGGRQTGGRQTGGRETVVRGSRSAVLLGLAVAAVVFLVPMLPVLAAMVRDTLAEGDFIQSGLGFSNAFSADLLGFFVPSHLHPLFGGLESRFSFLYINFMYVGLVALALAVIALVKVPRARAWGAWAALMVLVTLGPAVNLNGRAFDLPLPFDLLLQIPLIKGNRYPSRWSVMLTLCLAALVAFGLHYILARLSVHATRATEPIPQTADRGSQTAEQGALDARSAVRGPWAGRGTPALLTVLITAALLFEHLAVLPLDDFRIPAIYDRIGREAGDFTVLEVPVAWRNGFRVTGSYRNGSQGPIDRIFMLAQWYQTTAQRPSLNGNTSRNPELKFQYFAETPVLSSLVAIQAGHALSPEAQARDRALAPDLLRFFGARYVIWHAPYEADNREVANRTRAYLESAWPLDKVSEEYENGRGLVVYRVRELPPTPALQFRAEAPLARLALGEGWGAVAPALPYVWAERADTRVFLPLDPPPPGGASLALSLLTPVAGQTVQVSINGNALNPVAVGQGASTVSLHVPAGTLRAGMNDLDLHFSASIPVSELPAGDPRLEAAVRSRAIGTTGVASPVSLVVRSAGEEQGAFGHIYVDGQDQAPNTRGYNVVVLEARTGRVEARLAFDTLASETDSHALAEFLDALPEGRIVAVAASDEASLHLTADAVKALGRIGGTVDLRGKFRWSHALIGVTGAAAGSALEAASETTVSQLVLGLGVTEPQVYAALSEIR